MVRSIVQHVAALTESAQILEPIVRRIAVEMGRCEHDARRPKPSGLHEIRPTGGPSSAISPCRRLLVEPSAVWQAAEADEMWPAATLASALSGLEADLPAQLAPIWRIERAQLGSDGHCECA
jgi:hypothetical protein